MAKPVPIAGDVSVSREVALILACCRWPRSDTRNAAIADAAAAPVDWDRFLAMTARHRVDGLVHDGLRTAGVTPPAGILDALRARSLHIAGRALVQAGATLALGDLLRGGGIPALFVKGSSLEMLAYRELGLKTAHDIDVLVDRADFAAAGRLLEAGGWTRTIPPPTLREDLLERFLDLSRDAVFKHEAQGITLELHHRLAWHVAFDRVGPSSPRQDVAIFPGKAVPTLADEELYAYLVVHGAAHEWMRIKWLADLAGWLAHLPPETIAALHAFARGRGVGRFSAQALRLCHELLGTPVPPSPLREIEFDRGVARLCAEAIAAIEREQAMGESLGSAVRRVALDLRMQPTWRSRAKAVGRYLLNPADLTYLPLPRRLGFLYYFARVPLLIARRASGRLR